MKNNRGFTLIELMIAIMIFAILTIISYRTISALIATKETVTRVQDKWGGIAKAVAHLASAWNRTIPLVIRDENGIMVPAVIGKNKLESKYDAQIEMTLSGYIGDQIYGSSPPKRVGFRFVGGKLYLVTWPVLNRVLTTQPQLDLMLEDVDTFKVSFLYADKQWYDNWPPDLSSMATLPPAFKIYIKMKSGEEITRQWVF